MTRGDTDEVLAMAYLISYRSTGGNTGVGESAFRSPPPRTPHTRKGPSHAPGVMP